MEIMQNYNIFSGRFFRIFVESITNLYENRYLQ